MKVSSVYLLKLCCSLKCKAFVLSVSYEGQRFNFFNFYSIKHQKAKTIQDNWSRKCTKKLEE